MTDEIIYTVLKFYESTLIKLDSNSERPSNIGWDDFIKVIDYLDKRGFVKETDQMNHFKIANIGSEKLRELDLQKEKKESRQKKSDELLDLDLKLKTFESKIGKKLIIAGFIITVLSFLITILTLKIWNNNDKIIDIKPITKHTQFKSGRWIHEKDSLAGIEIKNGKWTMFYKGIETDSTDAYKYSQTTELPKYANTDLKPGEFLILTNKTDTLNFEILNYEKDKILSLLSFPNGRFHIYHPE